MKVEVDFWSLLEKKKKTGTGTLLCWTFSFFVKHEECAFATAQEFWIKSRRVDGPLPCCAK